MIAKLEVDGPNLAYPHQSAVKGSRLRELRPRRGRSRRRPLYRRIGGAAFVVFAIAPEGELNALGFKRAVRVAEARLAEMEGRNP